MYRSYDVRIIRWHFLSSRNSHRHGRDEDSQSQMHKGKEAPDLELLNNYDRLCLRFKVLRYV